MYTDHFISKIRNPIIHPRKLPDSVSQAHLRRPFRFPFIIYHRNDHGIPKPFLSGAPPFLHLHFPAVLRPYAHHVPQKLHGYVIVHQTLVLYQRNQKGRLPILPFFRSCYAPDPYFFHDIRLELRTQIRMVALGDILNILRPDIFQSRYMDTVSQKLGAEKRIAKNILTADIPIMLTVPFFLILRRIPHPRILQIAVPFSPISDR